jgi:hypothetical protein
LRISAGSDLIRARFMVIIVGSKWTPSARQWIAAEWKRIASASDLIRAEFLGTPSEWQRIAEEWKVIASQRSLTSASPVVPQRHDRIQMLWRTALRERQVVILSPRRVLPRRASCLLSRQPEARAADGRRSGAKVESRSYGNHWSVAARDFLRFQDHAL